MLGLQFKERTAFLADQQKTVVTVLVTNSYRIVKLSYDEVWLDFMRPLQERKLEFRFNWDTSLVTILISLNEYALQHQPSRNAVPQIPE